MIDYEPYHQAKIIGRNIHFSFDPDTLKIMNPNEIFNCIISLKRKYAFDLLSKGRIKFNTPSNWVKYAQIQSTGRGDIFEGTYASLPYLQQYYYYALITYPDSYVHPIQYKDSKLLCLKHKETMELPCYCFYILKYGNFKIEKEEGQYIARAQIPCRYFRGLEDGRNWESEQKLPEDERLVSIVIADYDTFINRIIIALNHIGIPNSEIIIRNMKYEDLSVLFMQKRNHPMELFVKDLQFSDQSEGRIVINTKNISMQKYLTNNTIDIGNIEDIAYLDDHYYSGGMFLSVKIN